MWGWGTQRIVELCLQVGHPEPEFEESAGGFTVRFPVAGYTPPHRIERDLTERHAASSTSWGMELSCGRAKSCAQLTPSPSIKVLRNELNRSRAGVTRKRRSRRRCPPAADVTLPWQEIHRRIRPDSPDSAPDKR